MINFLYKYLHHIIVNIDFTKIYQKKHYFVENMIVFEMSNLRINYMKFLVEPEARFRIVPRIFSHRFHVAS